MRQMANGGPSWKIIATSAIVLLCSILVALEGWSLLELQNLNAHVLVLQNTSATKAQFSELEGRVKVLEYVLEDVIGTSLQ